MKILDNISIDLRRASIVSASVISITAVAAIVFFIYKRMQALQRTAICEPINPISPLSANLAPNPNDVENDEPEGEDDEYEVSSQNLNLNNVRNNRNSLLSENLAPNPNDVEGDEPEGEDDEYEVSSQNQNLNNVGNNKKKLPEKMIDNFSTYEDNVIYFNDSTNYECQYLEQSIGGCCKSPALFEIYSDYLRHFNSEPLKENGEYFYVGLGSGKLLRDLHYVSFLFRKKSLNKKVRFSFIDPIYKDQKLTQHLLSEFKQRIAEFGFSSSDISAYSSVKEFAKTEPRASKIDLLLSFGMNEGTATPYTDGTYEWEPLIDYCHAKTGFLFKQCRLSQTKVIDDKGKVLPKKDWTKITTSAALVSNFNQSKMSDQAKQIENIICKKLDLI